MEQDWLHGQNTAADRNAAMTNSHLHREDFPHQVRSLRLCSQPVEFLGLAAPPMDCFSNELAPCAQTVFSKQSLCSPNLRKSAKGLPAQAERSAL